MSISDFVLKLLKVHAPALDSLTLGKMTSAAAGCIPSWHFQYAATAQRVV